MGQAAMTPDEIADELANYRATRAQALAGREAMQRIAVECCKIPQATVNRSKDQIDLLIEGWLIGAGIKPYWKAR